MRLRLRNIRGTIRSILVLLLAMSQLSLSQPLVSAVIGDLAWVSPGKIPRPLPAKEDNHFLGNSSFRVKLEYPRSFILQETVGDLSFLISLDDSRRRIDIYIPPEFKVTSSKNYVWSNITNNYGNIGISKASSFDETAPNWYDVSISNGTQGIELGNYSVRIFDVTAPSIAGRYFFKVFTNRRTIGAENFPSVVVSADPNPAYISGTVRYGGYLNASFYGRPIALTGLLGGAAGGKVQATGITPDGRIVVGQAFFSSSCSEYTLYGLAAGHYSLNATAAGFAPSELTYEIALKPGQSMEGVDIFLRRSPILSVAALSRRMKQAEPWGQVSYNETRQNRTITLEILDIWNTTVALLNGTTFYDRWTHTFIYNGSRDLDGHIPQSRAGFVAGIGPGRYYVRIWVNGYVQVSALNEWALTEDCAVVFTRDEQSRSIDVQLERTGMLNVTVHFRDLTPIHESPIPFGGTVTVKAYDINDILRASNSARVRARDNSTSIELTGLVGTRGYGIPRGVYTIEATLTGYVQPFEHKVTIGDGICNTSFYMLLLGRLNITVFSVSWQRPFKLINWRYPNSTITVEIRDSYGVEVYRAVRGFQPPWNYTMKPSANVTLANVTDLDDGTYSIHVFTYGYVQRQDVFFSVRRGGFADISVLMTIGVQINVTLVFEKQRIISPIDTYTKYWKVNDPRVPVRFEVYDSKAQFVAANRTYTCNYILDGKEVTICNVTLAGFNTTYYGNAAMRWVNYYDTTDGTAQKDGGLVPDLYTIKVYVPGYHQPIEPTIDVRTRGSVSVVLALHRMGHLYGMIHTFNTYFEYENLTRISWVSVDAIGEEMTLRTCTLDGAYELWMVPGSYLVMFSLPAYETKALRLQIPDGSDVRMDLQLLLFGTKLQSYVSSLSQLSAADTLKPVFLVRAGTGKGAKRTAPYSCET